MSIIISSCNISQDHCSEANVRGFTHANNQLLIIYKNTKGDIVDKIGPDEEAGYIVQIVGVRKDHFKIHIVDLEMENLWVEKGTISLNTRNYDIEKIPLYREADKSSDTVGHIVIEQTVKILDVCEEWAYIEGKGKNGEIIKGWLEPDMQCGNPYTTCP